MSMIKNWNIQPITCQTEKPEIRDFQHNPGTLPGPKMASRTHMMDWYMCVQPGPNQQNELGKCKKLYREAFATPMQGFSDYLPAYQWRVTDTSPINIHHLEAERLSRVPPTSITESHKGCCSIPGHSQYKVPEEISQYRTYEIYSEPKPLRYEPERKKCLRKQRIYGISDEYHARTKDYPLRYRRPEHAKDRLKDGRAKEEYVKFPKVENW